LSSGAQENLLTPLVTGLRRSAIIGLLINVVMALTIGSETSVMLTCIWLGAAILASQWLHRMSDRQSLAAA
jgi:hypothetical protein